jgi:tripartite-type tricarboxylate transporter receptor subunit TctC
MSTSKHLLTLCAGSITLLSASVFAPPAAAQEYPTKTVRIISPVPAGGLSDIAMRPMALELQKRLGQPVIIENRPGAGGTIAGRACAQAAPDGYTFCNLFNDVISNAPYLFKNIGYDPQNDFLPITNVYFITTGFLVTPELGVNSVAELIELSKKQPGGLNMGAPSTGAVLHIRDFNLFTGSKFQPIPYRSGGEVANALLTNTVQAGALGVGNLVPHIKAGKFKVLAVDSATRSPLLPEVPTLKELGLDHTRIKTWYGFLAPKGTPPAIIKRLRDEIVAIYKEPTMHERALINAGLEPDLTSTEEFMGHLARIAEQTAAQAKRLDVKPE